MNFKNKNILLIIHHGALGGAERQGLGLSKILVEDYNCEVDLLLTFSDKLDKDFETYSKECQIRKVHYFGPAYLNLPKKFELRNFKRLKWSLGYLWKLRKELNKYQYDIIIPFLNTPSKISFYLYKILPSVKITFWHQLGLDKWSRDIFEEIAAKHIPCVIANSPTGLELFSQQYRINKKYVLPQYVSLNYERGNRERILSNFQISEKKILIGMIAQYRYDKYHELLLKAFERINFNQYDVHLIFLGNKDISATSRKKFEELNKIIKKSSCNNRVSLLTNKKVQDVLNILDIGVLVSKIEGMPNAVMEYMLYGLPVVASNHPGCRQLVEDDINGFLVNNDEEDLFLALMKLIENKSLRLSMSRNNQSKIKQFDGKKYIHDLEMILTEVCSAKH
ncbi:glycosyltransferase [Christiangramia sp. SM2212]|uniref:Glycosyltransferase n=1 Tax=Christiangramia sediminicola TaxID=3073267 RepID=A0ABU1EMT7_9FLAO|nr:glycosyltransferase [Christiangramia sp. SM2212]MDR5589702.1 glycosyltransferase [Christiangramia sp. SM2212]